jgi:hypothetical protein
MKIRKINRVLLEEPVPVYDLTIEGTHNFKLGAGPFVHNSKDVSDAISGTCYMLFSKEAASHMRPTRRSLKTGTGDVRKIRFAARNSNTFRGSY